MKKRTFSFLLAIGVAITATSLFLAGCTKEGPMGPAGQDGQDGQDANATCTVCHTGDAKIVIAETQLMESPHGAEFVLENGSSCGSCHTHQGFIQKLALPDTTIVLSAAVNNGVHLNCYTCHKIHQTYTGTDWGLTASGAFTMKVPNATVNNGKGGLCIRCHQTRPRTPWPATFPPAATDSMNITSGHWGPHYGTQGVIYNGLSPFEFGTGYPTGNAHVSGIADGCVGCHMKPGAVEVGGHTFSMRNIEGGINATNSCNGTGCHTGLNTYDKDGKQTEIAGLLHQLEVKLAQLNAFDTVNHAIKTGKKPTTVVCAVYNYLLVDNDGSLGVHNYQYTKTLLTNTLAVLP